MDIMQNTDSQEIKKTIVILRDLSADEKIRQEVYYREKRLHDEATALSHAKREGLAEGRSQGLAEGRSQGLAEGRSEERQETVEKLRRKSFTDEQIKDMLDLE